MITIISKNSFRNQSYHVGDCYFAIQRNFNISINAGMERLLELNDNDYITFAYDKEVIYVGKVEPAKYIEDVHFIIKKSLNKLFVNNLGLSKHLMKITNTTNDTVLRFFLDIYHPVEHESIQLYRVKNIKNIQTRQK